MAGRLRRPIAGGRETLNSVFIKERPFFRVFKVVLRSLQVD